VLSRGGGEDAGLIAMILLSVLSTRLPCLLPCHRLLPCRVVTFWPRCAA